MSRYWVRVRAEYVVPVLATSRADALAMEPGDRDRFAAPLPALIGPHETGGVQAVGMAQVTPRAKPVSGQPAEPAGRKTSVENTGSVPRPARQRPIIREERPN